MDEIDKEIVVKYHTSPTGRRCLGSDDAAGSETGAVVAIPLVTHLSRHSRVSIPPSRRRTAAEPASASSSVLIFCVAPVF